MAFFFFFCISKEKKIQHDVKLKKTIDLLPDKFEHVKNSKDNIIIDDDYHVLGPLTFSNLTVSTMRDNSETKKSLHCKFYSDYIDFEF